MLNKKLIPAYVNGVFRSMLITVLSTPFVVLLILSMLDPGEAMELANPVCIVFGWMIAGATGLAILAVLVPFTLAFSPSMLTARRKGTFTLGITGISILITMIHTLYMFKENSTQELEQAWMLAAIAIIPAGVGIYFQNIEKGLSKILSEGFQTEDDIEILA